MAVRPQSLESRLKRSIRRHWTYRLNPLEIAAAGQAWGVSVPARGRQVARIGLVAAAHGQDLAGIEALVRALETGVIPGGIAAEAYLFLAPSRTGEADGQADVALKQAIAREIGGQHFDTLIELTESELEGFFLAEWGGRAGLGAAVVQELARKNIPLASEPALAALGSAPRVQAGLLSFGNDRPVDRRLALASIPLGLVASTLVMASPRSLTPEARTQVHLSAIASLLGNLARGGRFAEFASQGRIVPFTSEPSRR